MKKEIPKSRGGKRLGAGRPATGRDPVSAIRLPAELTTAIDKWAAKNGAPSRSDAIRRLVELGLAGAQPSGLVGKKTAAKASELAGEIIDRLSNKLLSTEEREERKSRLLKGPPEFRDLRTDRRKAKR
jgi:Arc/MetJ-type ribon-helix-helix transcriptional regulator